FGHRHRQWRQDSRNLLLTLANLGLKRAGFVSAFLQAETLEGEHLAVWAPAELSSVWGGPGESGRLHVDDFIGGKQGTKVYEKAMEELRNSYQWGKWEDDEFTFAGIKVKQHEDMSITIDQNDYTDQWVEEIDISKDCASQSRGSQTSQFQADTGLLLSIPYATVDTIIRANKLVLEMRTSHPPIFSSWKVPWEELAVVVWADASIRPDKGSTMGIVAGIAPRGILWGEEHQIALLHCRSAKTELRQAITEDEDVCFRLRALLAELNGEVMTRENMDELVKHRS
ncbi:unnamed protein product, partial [Effrenium voratum]